MFNYGEATRYPHKIVTILILFSIVWLKLRREIPLILRLSCTFYCTVYGTENFLPHDMRSAKCGIAIVSCPSVCPSVSPICLRRW